jgi:hypothetical protein
VLVQLFVAQVKRQWCRTVGGPCCHSLAAVIRCCNEAAAAGLTHDLPEAGLAPLFYHVFRGAWAGGVNGRARARLVQS